MMMNVRLSLTRPLALAVWAAVALGLLAACGDDPTPTPAPTPTPTPNPIIALPPGAVWGDVVDVLSEPEQQCLRDSAGASFDASLDAPVFGGIGGYLTGDVVDCLPDRTILDLVIANLSHQAGGLSRSSAACIRGAFANADLRAAVGVGGESPSEDRAVFGGVLGMLLCLTDDEANRISVSDLFNTGELGLSLGDLRCVIQRVDVGLLLDLFVSDGPDAGLPDLSQTVELLAALRECGVDLTEMGFEYSPIGVEDPLAPTVGPGVAIETEDLPPEIREALACLAGVLGEEKIAAILEGTYAPAPADLEALSTCNLDFARIFELLAQMEP